MEKLDQTYLTELVGRAKAEGGNAFAELFAATQPHLFAYITIMIGEGEAAEAVLRDAFVHMLRGLPSLTNEALFLPWAARICFQECSARSRKSAGVPDAESLVFTPVGSFPAAHILNLPLTESQILLMRYGQNISERDIGDILNFSRGLLRRCLKSGVRHLQDHAELPSAEPAGERGSAGAQRMKQVRLSAARSTALLEEIFELCGREPNTIPMAALSSYAVYRRERFSLQRGILAGALVLFLLLPLLFVLPKVSVDVEERGERGLPVYTVQVSSILPIRSVTARLRSRTLPVYEAAARLFTVEPTRNGELTIAVELVNRQGVTTRCPVTAVDSRGPVLADSEIRESTVRLVVEDVGIGVDFAEIYAVGASGAIYFPESVQEESGEVLFAYPEENWDVYIPDHIGNTLHLSLTLE